MVFRNKHHPKQFIKSGFNYTAILIAGDLNAKLGKDMMRDDQHETNPNGAFLKKLIDRHELVVGNILDKCDGLWTRVRNKQNVHEKSVIDYIIIDSFLDNNIVRMKIDEEKHFCPFSA